MTFDDDAKAIDHLIARGFTNSYGIIKVPHDGFILSEEDEEAIAYLCSEWDYGYEPSYADRDTAVARGDTP